nr:MAG TPA: hypothetical protein [Caudoviricetes sp.]
MKVVIELLGNESKQDLLATSNYLRELAEGSLPVPTKAKVHDPNCEAKAYNPNCEAKAYNPNAKTDLDKLADAVVEATKVREEAAPVKTVSEHVAEERAKTRASRTKKVEEPAPIEAPAPVEEVAAPVEEVAAPSPAPKAPAAPVEKPSKDETEHTVEECKQWAMKALNAKKRPLVQEAFEQVGATSFPTLKESMFAEFIEYISTRL